MKYTEFELVQCPFLARVANTVWAHSCLRLAWHPSALHYAETSHASLSFRSQCQSFFFSCHPFAMTGVFPYMYKKYIGNVFVCCYYAIA